MRLQSRVLIVACGGLVVVGAMGVTAHAQVITVTSRGGMNIAYCGIPGVGPLVQHSFSTADAVHDSISVSDPGGASWPFSESSAQFDSTSSFTGITLAVAGSGRRGSPAGFGVNATADGRDSWEFDLNAPACFTFSGSISCASTESTVPTQAFSFAGLGIVPAPGTPADAFSVSLSVPGSVARTATGMLMPGHYSLRLFGRAEGNGAPYAGSYANAVAVSIGPPPTPSAPAPARACAGAEATFGVTASGPGPFTYQWRVESPAGSGAYVDVTAGTFTEPSSGLTFDTAGVTSPLLTVSNVQLGDHPNIVRFAARVFNACGGVTSGSTTLTVCGADLNCDELVDFSDYLEFLNRFDAQDPSVDFNHDGIVDFSDYLQFLNMFDIGC